MRPFMVMELVDGGDVDPQDGNRPSLFDLSGKRFKKATRFRKRDVKQIANYLQEDLNFSNNRNHPYSPKDQVAIALMHLAGGHFQRINGLAAGGLSQNGSRVICMRVVEALVKKRGDWLFFPSVGEQRATAKRLHKRFGLKGFIGGVDGCHMRWQKQIRGLRPNVDPQVFWCRKNFYSINCQLVCNDKRIIDVDCAHSGTTHNAHVWHHGSMA